MNKYQIEKDLHKLIRDLPEIAKINRLYDRGYLTTEEALKEIAEVLYERRTS